MAITPNNQVHQFDRNPGRGAIYLCGTRAGRRYRSPPACGWEAEGSAARLTLPISGCRWVARAQRWRWRRAGGTPRVRRSRRTLRAMSTSIGSGQAN